MKECRDFYNSQRILLSVGLIDDVDFNSPKINWTTNVLSSAKNNIEISEEKAGIEIVNMYRPFFKQHVLYSRFWNERIYQIPKSFPSGEEKNLLIGFSCAKTPTVLITNKIPDLHYIGDSQCFPLYWFEENKNKQRSLFDEESNDDYIRRDGITDWILKEVRTRYGTRNITKEMIFYYVYGLLHSKDYRERFAADLKKSLPRIPIVESLDDFMDFYKAGKELADLHLNYETVAPYPDVIVHGDRQVPLTVKRDPATGGYIQAPENEGAYDYFRVVDKMRFKSKQDKSAIIYNGNITIENIPQKAYEYIVNGKSAIEWIVERYCVSQDKKSLIKNDAND